VNACEKFHRLLDRKFPGDKFKGADGEMSHEFSSGCGFGGNARGGRGSQGRQRDGEFYF
jgi:hypothetical protein